MKILGMKILEDFILNKIKINAQVKCVSEIESGVMNLKNVEEEFR